MAENSQVTPSISQADLEMALSLNAPESNIALNGFQASSHSSALWSFRSLPFGSELKFQAGPVEAAALVVLGPVPGDLHDQSYRGTNQATLNAHHVSLRPKFNRPQLNSAVSDPHEKRCSWSLRRATSSMDKKKESQIALLRADTVSRSPGQNWRLAHQCCDGEGSSLMTPNKA
ncbi:hypothetical protein PM082_010087 [Marasmius tenuissimus]|nr:hypothetical protein PM082_010087 [Marasmius tenuissimus]